ALALRARRRLFPDEEDTSAPAAVTLGLATIGFLALSLASRRFAEFWAPFSTMFAAAAVAAWWPGEPTRVGPVRSIHRVGLAGAATLVIIVGWDSALQARRVIDEDPGMVFTGCATWIRDHAAPDEIIFTTDWDEFPELFFTAPRQRYLVGLDPTFMYVTSPD